MRVEVAVWLTQEMTVGHGGVWGQKEQLIWHGFSVSGLTQFAGIARIKENYPKVNFDFFPQVPSSTLVWFEPRTTRAQTIVLALLNTPNDQHKSNSFRAAESRTTRTKACFCPVESVGLL